MKKDIKSMLTLVIFIVILIVIFKFVLWLFPIILGIFIGYLIYRFFTRVKDKVNENDNTNRVKISKKGKVMEGTIVREKNDD